MGNETSEVEALAKVFHEAMEKDDRSKGVMGGLPISVLEAVARAVRAQDAGRGGTLSAEALESARVLAGGPMSRTRSSTIYNLLDHSAAQGRAIAAKDARIAELEGDPTAPIAHWREKAKAAESALATLRQAVEGEVADCCLDATPPVCDRCKRLLAALNATPAEHSDTATLRAIRERAKDADALGRAAAEGVATGRWDTTTDADDRDAYREMGESVAEYLLGDSGPSGGGERVCRVCEAPESKHDSEGRNVDAGPECDGFEPTTPPDGAASETPRTAEDVAAAINAERMHGIHGLTASVRPDGVVRLTPRALPIVSVVVAASDEDNDPHANYLQCEADARDRCRQGQHEPQGDAAGPEGAHLCMWCGTDTKAASEPTPEEDWRTVEAVIVACADENTTWPSLDVARAAITALARLKSEPRRAAEDVRDAALEELAQNFEMLTAGGKISGLDAADAVRRRKSQPARRLVDADDVRRAAEAMRERCAEEVRIREPDGRISKIIRSIPL